MISSLFEHLFSLYISIVIAKNNDCINHSIKNANIYLEMTKENYVFTIIDHNLFTSRIMLLIFLLASFLSSLFCY